MALTDHPKYDAYKVQADKIEDAHEGEDHVKSKTTLYLPATAGMVEDGMSMQEKGWKGYQAYIRRARFPDFVEDAMETLIGILNTKDVVVEMPEEMEYLRTCATDKGESLIVALLRIQFNILLRARVGVLADINKGTNEPYLVIYPGTCIRNWVVDEELDPSNNVTYLVLDESSDVFDKDSMSWTEEDRRRMCQRTENGSFETGVGIGGEVPPEMLTPSIKGATFPGIPFVFGGPRNNLPDIDRFPLDGLANLCYAIYLAEADYRQNLYMQGQDTLVVMGGMNSRNALDPSSGEQGLRVGAGARIDINVGGDAKYIGVSANGLSEQRSALDKDYDNAALRAGKLMSPGKSSLESGEALKTRVAAQTATLNSIGKSSATTLELSLKNIAKWKGLDVSKVKVTPNLEFTNLSIAGQELVQLITAKKLGYPISFRELHEIARQRNLTTMTFEQTVDQCKNDPEIFLQAMLEAGTVTGNNPVEAAGGGKKPPASDPKRSNSQNPTEK